MRKPLLNQRVFIMAILVVITTTAMGHSIRFAGSWEGNGQYQLIQATGRSSDTHAVPQFILHIGPHGEIAGGSPQDGCEFEGTARPDGLDPSLTLGITVSECQKDEYNGRYLGTFSYSTEERNGTVTLKKIPASQESQDLTAEITATVVPLD